MTGTLRMTVSLAVLCTLLLGADPTREATITVTLQCPACQPCAECPPGEWHSVENNIRWLGPCLTGPKRMRGGVAVEGQSFAWAFRPVDRTQLCSLFDADGDWDVDLQDAAMVLNGAGGAGH